MVKAKYVFAASFAAGATTALVLLHRENDPVRILLIRRGGPVPNIAQIHRADVVISEGWDGEFHVIAAKPSPDAVTLMTPKPMTSAVMDFLDYINSRRKK